LNGLYAFGGTYATFVLGWSVVQIGVFGIVAIVASVLFCWVGGKIDKRVGPKPLIVICILLLMGVCMTVIGMTRDSLFGVPLPEGSGLSDTIFMVCGALIGGLGGVLQSSSRNMMVRHTDPQNPTEYFGLYGLSGRATSFLAPALIAAVTAATQNVRLGMAPIVGLFAIGLVLLVWVKAKGEQYT
jgi:UMF1 family MFS transporter